MSKHNLQKLELTWIGKGSSSARMPRRPKKWRTPLTCSKLLPVKLLCLSLTRHVKHLQGGILAIR
ncbi:MAG TPA: hypothetical protein VIM16_05940 [Mucilaginibacter sp.]|jgi:hypothetical protein